MSTTTIPSSAPLRTPKPYPCDCPPSTPPGTVLLFYRYYAAPPTLSPALDPNSLKSFHTALATSLHLTGKLRLSHEGFNITIAGPTQGITTYMTACLKHESFAGLPLSTPALKTTFFKPSPGCACIFPSLSIRICDEITPMGITGYMPKDWGTVTEINPNEWHDLLTAAPASSPTSQSTPGLGPPEITLLDVRNHYESAIGYFVSTSNSPSNPIPALRPPIRRFSQFPLYMLKHGLAALTPHPTPPNPPQNTHLLAYCTGGIRCEKATRFLFSSLPSTSSIQITTLRGGIAAYLLWLSTEIHAGRLTPADSAFKGRNYVFDGRGSVGLAEESEIVGICVRCARKRGRMRMRTCASQGCRLEVVVCGVCEGEEEGEVVCCADCRDLDLDLDLGSGVGVATETGRKGGRGRGMCQCEKEREARLWGENDGDGGGKDQRKQGWRTKRRKDLMQMQVVSGAKEKVDIQVRLIRPERERALIQ